jgi:hypothetical protein
MTKADVQLIVKSKLTEALIDTTTIQDDLNQLFANWFQGLVQAGIEASKARMEAMAPKAEEEEGGGEE